MLYAPTGLGPILYHLVYIGPMLYSRRGPMLYAPTGLGPILYHLVYIGPMLYCRRGPVMYAPTGLGPILYHLWCFRLVNFAVMTTYSPFYQNTSSVPRAYYTRNSSSENSLFWRRAATRALVQRRTMMMMMMLHHATAAKGTMKRMTMLSTTMPTMSTTETSAQERDVRCRGNLTFCGTVGRACQLVHPCRRMSVV